MTDFRLRIPPPDVDVKAVVVEDEAAVVVEVVVVGTFGSVVVFDVVFEVVFEAKLDSESFLLRIVGRVVSLNRISSELFFKMGLGKIWLLDEFSLLFWLLLFWFWLAVAVLLIELVSVIGNSEFPRSEEFLRSEFRSEEFRNSEFRSEFRLAASLLSCKVRDEERVLRDGFGTSCSFSGFDVVLGLC